MTDAFYQDIRDNVADDLIREFGRAVTLRDEGSDVFDGATGFVTTASTPTDYPVTGVFTKVKFKELPNTNVVKTEFMVLLSVKNRNTNEVLAVTPTTSMLLLDGTDQYTIFAVDPVRPGNIDVIYKLKVRK